MNNFKHSCVILIVILTNYSTSLFAEELISPDGHVVVTLSTNQENVLHYSIKFNDQIVIESSALGISVDNVDFGEAISISTPRISHVDETYSLRGGHSSARNHYRQFVFAVTHLATETKMNLTFRVFDDGVAYRFALAGSTARHVHGESSSWKIVNDAKVWFFERNKKKWKLKSYAGEWISTNVDNLLNVSPSGPVQGTPLVFEIPNQGGFAAITKAACTNYSGMRLKAIGNRTVVADFTEGKDGFDVDGPLVTPWRATILAKDLNALVNCDLISNLNPAPDLKLYSDTSYIKPGRSVWRFETLDTGTPTEEQAFVDYAAEMGIEYSLIDDGWKDWDLPWESLKPICDHANEKSVGVWIWVHSDDIDDPKDNYRRMREYFSKTTAAGAVGVKIDFMNSESKQAIDFEIAALRMAATEKLMINFHGCHSSTGESRTYPNEMTREGIRGIEVNKMKEGPLPASHNAALPFTRFLVGHADYTPIAYTKPGPTTWAHQLATPILFYSPLQVFADHPEYLLRDPQAKLGLGILQSIPTTWDETTVLEGSEIGKLAAIARRHGDHWFVGALNDETSRKYTLDFSFLPVGNYKATIATDDINASPIQLEGLNRKAKLQQYTTAIPFKIESKIVDRTQRHTFELASGGGFAIVLSKR